MNSQFERNNNEGSRGDLREQLGKLFGRPNPPEETEVVLESAPKIIPTPPSPKRKAHEIRLYRTMSKAEYEKYSPVLKKFQTFMVRDRYRYNLELLALRNKLFDAIEANDQKSIPDLLKKFETQLDAEIERDEKGDKERLAYFLKVQATPRDKETVLARNIYNDDNNHYKKISLKDGSLIQMTPEEIVAFDKVDDAVHFKYAVAFNKGEVTEEMIREKDELLDLIELYKFEEAGKKADAFLQKHHSVFFGIKE